MTNHKVPLEISYLKSVLLVQIQHLQEHTLNYSLTIITTLKHQSTYLNISFKCQSNN